MVVTAHQVRTSLAIAAASATVIAALLLTPSSDTSWRCGTGAMQTSDIIQARLVSRVIVGGEQDIAVTIKMPEGRAQARPPLSLAIVIDRSGSMTGTPIANAKAAAATLIDKLDERDAFTVITYSSEAETVVAMTRATTAGKAAARAAIGQIWDDGNTCISCGIERAAAELGHTPIGQGVRRMVLISDGQANAGVSDRGELAQLATETAARGISISTAGVGLDFDEVTMMHLASVGHGDYYFVEDTEALGEMFAAELGGLADTVAADVRLVIEDGAGTQLEDAYGYPIMREGDQVTVPIADLRAGETRKVVLRASIASAQTGRRWRGPDSLGPPGPRWRGEDSLRPPGPLHVARFTLHWRKPADGTFESARTDLATTIVRDAAEVAATLDRQAINIVEQARTARVLEQATVTYEQQGYQAAQKLIERNLRDVRANGNVDTPAVQAIEAASSAAIDNFAKAPAPKAMKATRADAYKLAH